MRLRVDLLREEERRQQGGVGRKFILQAAGGALVGVLLLFGAIQYSQYAGLKTEMADLDARWKALQPEFEKAKKDEAGFAKMEALYLELKPWASNRVDWASHLNELAAMVHPSLQLTRFSMRAEWTVVKPPAPPPRTPPPGADGETPPPRPVPLLPGSPARKFGLSLGGRAAGDLGSEQAGELVKTIKKSPGIGVYFDSVKLLNVLQDVRQNDLADRSFTIEGSGAARKLE
jgi:hypothetical protein